MAAYSTGNSWSFPEDLPGGWVDVGDEDYGSAANTQHSNARTDSQPTSEPPPQPRRRRTRYPSRQCRICLEVVEPTFETPPEAASNVPAALQPEPRVTHDSGLNEGGRLLRPCKCKGSQKYVHEECLAAWRLQDPLQKRNYWQCPTCSYKYSLQRLTWSSWLSSTSAQIGLTISIFAVAMFGLGFVADPIINLYLDPVGTIAAGGSGPTGSLLFEKEAVSWSEHFAKGLASLGLLGFAKFLLTLSPWHWFNMRGTGAYVGRGGSGSGRDRLNQLSWVAIMVGVGTFLYAVWKGVRAWSRRTLQAAGERVLDVSGDDDDEDDDEGQAQDS